MSASRHSRVVRISVAPALAILQVSSCVVDIQFPFVFLIRFQFIAWNLPPHISFQLALRFYAIVCCALMFYLAMQLHSLFPLRNLHSPAAHRVIDWKSFPLHFSLEDTREDSTYNCYLCDLVANREVCHGKVSSKGIRFHSQIGQTSSVALILFDFYPAIPTFTHRPAHCLTHMFTCVWVYVQAKHNQSVRVSAIVLAQTRAGTGAPKHSDLLSKSEKGGRAASLII